MSSSDVCLTVAGPGFGEACVARLPGGLFVAIDSCKDESGDPVTFRLLRELGYDSQKHRLIVIITHWHSDHISGMSKFLSAMNPEFVVIPAAFNDERFLKFARALGVIRNTHFDAPTSEFVRVLSVLRERRPRVKRVLLDSLIYRDSDADLEIFALSPTQNGIESFLERVAALIPDPQMPPPAIPPLSENASSVAILIKLAGWSAVFGADLEEDALGSWSEITKTSQALGQGKTVHFFKVPHHGSRNGFCRDFHEAVLAEQSIFVVTPYNRGANPPPSSEDLQRMGNYSGHVFITGNVEQRITNLRKTFGSETEKFLRGFGIVLSERNDVSGAVSVQSTAERFSPSLTLNGSAILLQ